MESALNKLVRLASPAVLLCLLFALAATGCGVGSKGGDASTPTPTPPQATPTVDIAHARRAFESGGELSYEEVVALRREIVGDPAEIDKLAGTDKYYEEQDKFFARERDFATKLERCKLKETVGWVAWSRHERDEKYNLITDKNRVAIYVYNPFYGFGKDLRVDWSGYPEMFLGYFTDKEVEQLEIGQRITFSGDLFLLDRHGSVKHAKYAFLDDDPTVPAPTADDLKDLRIILDRTMCYGTCPDYTLTVEADGRVTFEGRHYTKEKGTVTGTIDSAKLAELATEIKKADFFSLDSSYSSGVTDNPTYTLEVHMDGKSKRVESYATRPRRLELLMDRIDQILNSKQWIGDGK
ncbi:MAG: DUF6438 domain-containing protein [Chloroflexia bacterium]